MSIHGLCLGSKTPKPPHFDIERVIRPNILALHPYRCARDDYQNGILLDANENALGHSILPSDLLSGPSEIQPSLGLNLHRYPDPSHPTLKSKIAALRGLPDAFVDHIFLGVGSDEVIDLLMRVSVKPGGEEKIMITPPTYGMYAVCAQVNDIGVVKVNLTTEGFDGEGGEMGRFSLRMKQVKEAIDRDPLIKLIFLCSPGNPTGTLISLKSIRELLDYENFKGIVVVDEAYIDFSGSNTSAISLVREYGNLCVMQTLSKSFGLAAIRLGIAIAQPPLIQILSNTKAPYNISTLTAHIAETAFGASALGTMHANIQTLIESRERMLLSLSKLAHLGLGSVIGGNDANFVMLPILGRGDLEGKPDSARAHDVYKTLAEREGVVVRFRGNEVGCQGCLRITIGTELENQVVLEKLEKVLRLC